MSGPIAGATSSSYTTPPLTHTGRYWVRVFNSAGSLRSNTAIVSMAFIDDQLTPGVSVIRAVHVTELRTRINALRAQKGLRPYSFFTTPTAGLSLIRAWDITELRQALFDVYAASGKAGPTYTNSVVSAGMMVKAVDMTELRNAVIAIE